MRTIARELHEGAILIFSIALGIGCGALLRLLLGQRDTGWRLAVVLCFGFAVMVGTGAMMHAYR